ncbi:hypothetical protein H9P43_002158 [Blastocladiella emersonii ATCC 22665]|nr:hypothetical protein H9P43_002158 [Blastocladiella emersonii ATCC 22665]
MQSTPPGHAPPAGSAGGDPAPIPQKRARTSQACENCKVRKIRCGGGLPCAHCFQFALQCEYKLASKRKSKATIQKVEAMAQYGDPSTLLLQGHLPAADAGAGDRSSGDERSDGTPSASSCAARGAAPASASASTSAAPATAFQPHPPSDPVHLGRVATKEDIEDITNNTMLLVRLGKDGKAKAFSNLGPSNGMHVLREWSTTLSDGVVNPPHGKNHPPRDCSKPCKIGMRENLIFPERTFVDTMVNVYFDFVHPYIPLLDRSAVEAELDAERPNRFLLYSLLACAATKFELVNNISTPCDRMLLSGVFAERAKTRLFQIRSGAMQSIEGVQGSVLLTFHSCHIPGGNSKWMLSGYACRLAQGLGLHLDLRAGQFEKLDVCVPTWSKTWALVHMLDRVIAMETGRPLMIQEEEAFLSIDTFLRTPENLAKYDADLLLDPDHYFVWAVRLADIAGKLVRALNGIARQRDLPYTLPLLHSLLTRYRSELPKRLQFSPDEPDRHLRMQSAILNLRYYALVVGLYRPLVSAKASVIESPLKHQYLALLEGALQAMVQIAFSIRGELAWYPQIMHHELVSALSVCAVLATHDHSEGRATTRNVVGYLERINAVIDAALVHWPFTARLARTAREMLAKIRGTVPDLAEIDAHMSTMHQRIHESMDLYTEYMESSPEHQQAVMATHTSFYLELDGGAHAPSPARASTTASSTSPSPATSYSGSQFPIQQHASASSVPLTPPMSGLLGEACILQGSSATPSSATSSFTGAAGPGSSLGYAYPNAFPATAPQHPPQFAAAAAAAPLEAPAMFAPDAAAQQQHMFQQQQQQQFAPIPAGLDWSAAAGTGLALSASGLAPLSALPAAPAAASSSFLSLPTLPDSFAVNNLTSLLDWPNMSSSSSAAAPAAPPSSAMGGSNGGFLPTMPAPSFSLAAGTATATATPGVDGLTGFQMPALSLFDLDQFLMADGNGGAGTGMDGSGGGGFGFGFGGPRVMQ